MIVVHTKKMETVMKQYKTEDLGKMFEMAICLLYNTPYDGKYKYNMAEAALIKERIIKLKDVFPGEIKHIAKNGSKYDFVSTNGAYLSAKTTKRDGKVCPQLIGQPSKKKFCDYFGAGDMDVAQTKEYIVENVAKLLDAYTVHTFECPIIYYNKAKNELLFVKLKEQINWTNWTNITFSHVLKNKAWNESTSIKMNQIPIGEFQIHQHRDGVKFRWSFKNILNVFKDHFEITIL